MATTDNAKEETGADFHPNRTPELHLPYPTGGDAVRITPTFSKEEMMKLDGHSHNDSFIQITELETDVARAEKALNAVLSTQVATIRRVNGTKDEKGDTVLLNNDPDTDPSISMAISETTTDRFFINNVYSSTIDHDDVQVIRVRNVFRKVKDS